jgi:hypothetical protein
MKTLKERTMPTIFLAALISLLAASSVAYAKDDEGCTRAPKEQWLSIQQLKAKLTDKGFTVSKVEIEDGCAEADAKDKDGRTVVWEDGRLGMANS